METLLNIAQEYMIDSVKNIIDIHLVKLTKENEKSLESQHGSEVISENGPVWQLLKMIELAERFGLHASIINDGTVAIVKSMEKLTHKYETNHLKSLQSALSTFKLRKKTKWKIVKGVLLKHLSKADSNFTLNCVTISYETLEDIKQIIKYVDEKIM